MFVISKTAGRQNRLIKDPVLPAAFLPSFLATIRSGEEIRLRLACIWSSIACMYDVCMYVCAVCR